MISSALFSQLNLEDGTFPGATLTRRHLADLKGLFVDTVAYAQTLASGDPQIYSVAAVEPAQGEGQLYYGLGVLMPGKIGREYYFTKGHYHAWRPAAEVYVGLRGKGLMLMEGESGESRLMNLETDSVVYVPGHTAHRTINTSSVPLVYLGIYPAAAGHDYAAVAGGNFRNVVLEQNGRPVMLKRSELVSL